jgi:hypothetical protein
MPATIPVLSGADAWGSGGPDGLAPPFTALPTERISPFFAAVANHVGLAGRNRHRSGVLDSIRAMAERG